MGVCWWPAAREDDISLVRGAWGNKAKSRKANVHGAAHHHGPEAGLKLFWQVVPRGAGGADVV